MAVAGVIVLTAAVIALVYVTEARMRAIAVEQRRIHLQQAQHHRDAVARRFPRTECGSRLGRQRALDTGS